MFSIFNGKVRGLGDKPKNRVHMRVSVRLREYLHHFKGAKLAIFMAIALHADENGWSEPTVAQLRKETGYEPATISAAITSLCNTVIDGNRVLMSVVLRKQGKFDRNRYLIFPSPEELIQYADQQRKHRTQKTIHGKTVPEKPSMENCVDGINHKEEEPIKEKEESSNTTNGASLSFSSSSSSYDDPFVAPIAVT
jgi:hypothetical protein